ncbi:hypothetical protein G7046_g1938 [Stylonectria norvegica]|nr:hypothetical protein G7046_g1938 [Stylonectria norvegica]
MEETQNEPMAHGSDHENHLPLSEDEEKAWALYDKLQELRLEIAIINAQQKLLQSDEDTVSSPTDEETRRAQWDLVETQAKHRLRNDVVDAVVIANPILKAVHGGTDADLLAYVEQRDNSSISVAQKDTESGRLWDELITVQSQTLRAARHNVELTAELFKLTDEVQRKQKGADTPKARQHIETLEGDFKISKKRWRVLKGVAGGVVVGSGVDWADDGELRDIVLDPEVEA